MSTLELDIFVDYLDPTEAVRQIFHHLKPEANIDDILIEDYSAGYVNKNLNCHTGSRKDGIFIRIFSKKWNGLLDGESYTNVSRVLDGSELSPKLLATFKNGLCHKFVDGECLSWKTRKRLLNNDVNRAVLRAMARFHSRDTLRIAQAKAVPDDLDELNQNKKFEQVLKYWNDFIEDPDVPKSLKQSLPEANEINAERTELNRLLTLAGADKALCHMDANPTNIIIKEDGEVALIDYDLTAINYCCMDLAGYFHYFMDISDPILSDYPDARFRRQSVRYYLECRRQVENAPAHVTAEDTELLYEQIQIARLYWLWRFTLAGPTVYRCSHDKKKGEKLLGHATMLWNEFKRFKQEILGQHASQKRPSPLNQA